MAFDTSQLTDYTWSQIALAAKQAMMSAALGGANYSIGGNSLGRISIDDAKKLYEFATQQAEDEAAGESGGGLALARFGERV